MNVGCEEEVSANHPYHYYAHHSNHHSLTCPHPIHYLTIYKIMGTPYYLDNACIVQCIIAIKFDFNFMGWILDVKK
jgi:hypothetical protein